MVPLGWRLCLAQAVGQVLLLRSACSRELTATPAPLINKGTPSQLESSRIHHTTDLPARVPTKQVATTGRRRLSSSCVSDGTVTSAQKISNSYGGLSSFYALGNIDYFGTSSSGIGDLDGDGVADLVVGARSDDDGNSNAGAEQQKGRLIRGIKTL